MRCGSHSRRSQDDGRADAVVAIDADSVVYPTCCRLLHSPSSLPCRPITGYSVPKVPGRTRLLAIAIAANHVVRSRARATGAAFLRDPQQRLVRDAPLAASGGIQRFFPFSEDLKFGIDLRLCVDIAFFMPAERRTHARRGGMPGPPANSATLGPWPLPS